jgi:hypothetical protein
MLPAHIVFEEPAIKRNEPQRVPRHPARLRTVDQRVLIGLSPFRV